MAWIASKFLRVFLQDIPVDPFECLEEVEGWEGVWIGDNEASLNIFNHVQIVLKLFH